MQKILLTFLLSILGFTPLFSATPNLTNPFVFGNCRITVITDGLVRLEYAVDGAFSDEQTLFAWDRTSLYKECRIEQLDSTTYLIQTPRMKIRYIADNYPFGIFNLNIEFDNAGKRSVWNTRRSAFPSANNLRGAVATLDQVNGRCKLNEGILSRDGFYLVDDTGKERIIDGWLASGSEKHLQDYYVFIYGNDYKSALKSLGAISGKAPMNRKYMHGAWYCRFHNYSADDYRQIVREYDTYDFPLDVMVFDMDWHTMNARIGSGHGGRRSWTGYTWNRKQFPDPGALIAEFARDSIAVTLNDHPADGIRPHEACYTDFIHSLGLAATDPCPLFDAGNRNYMKQFFRHALQPHEDLGVAFWWLDWQQDYLQPYVRPTRVRHLPWLNHLYYTWSQRRNNLRGGMYSRWGGLGSHRYPIQFSGDAAGSWETLAFEVEMTATSGNEGCFFWTHDIGGHMNGDDSELFVRWTQFGALSSTLRVHSSADARDRRPWLWGDQATAAMRKAYHLRSELMPYIYTSLRQTHEEMLPLVRAMYIDYPHEEEAYRHPQQYLFGDNLLAAPIVTPVGADSTATCQVWFPAGEDWYRFDNGSRHAGGSREEIHAALDEIPLFARGGHIIPMQPYARRMASARLTTLRARVYPAAEGSRNTTTLYEDDGLTTDYLQGKFAKTDMTCELKENRLTLTIHPTVGVFNDQPARRAVVFEVWGLSPKAVIKGLPQGAVVKRQETDTTITLPEQDIRKSRHIVIEKAYDRK